MRNVVVSDDGVENSIVGDHTLIPACDVGVDKFRKIVEATHELAGIGGYKIGFRLGLEIGLPAAVKLLREYTNKPVIYDHQKAANDIPDTGRLFAEVCAQAGLDYVILFPLTGPATLKAWVQACQQQELQVIVGGVMTHEKFLVREGGFIADDAVYDIYALAADLGVRDFVVPSTKFDLCMSIYDVLKKRDIKPRFYSPGIGKQGGNWQTLKQSEVPAWHAIVGRSLYSEGDIKINANKFLTD